MLLKRCSVPLQCPMSRRHSDIGISGDRPTGTIEKCKDPSLYVLRSEDLRAIEISTLNRENKQEKKLLENLVKDFPIRSRSKKQQEAITNAEISVAKIGEQHNKLKEAILKSVNKFTNNQPIQPNLPLKQNPVPHPITQTIQVLQPSPDQQIQPVPANPASRTRNIQCWNCNRFGHIAAKCRSLNRPAPFTRRPFNQN